MPMFGPPPLPPQRRPPPLPSVTAAAPSSATGTAAGTSTAAAIAPFGAGVSAGTSSAAAVGAALGTGTGTATGTSTGTATSATGSPFPLTVSSDGRYFKQSDGTPFLICADTTWSLAVNIPLASIDAFLVDITSRGFNAVMSNAIEHHYTVTAPPKDRAGLVPFTKQLGAATFTGSPSGTTGAAGTQGQFTADPYSNINNQAADWTFPNNSYWQNIETILSACLAHGVMVFVWPAYLGFHVNDEGWLNEMVIVDAVTGAGGFTGQPWADATKSKLWNYGAWLADRWKAYPHIVWVMGGDYGANTQTLNTAQRNAVNNVMAGLKSVAGQSSLLYTAHWERPCISDDTTMTAGAWDLNFAYADDATAELTRRGYAVASVKPTILGEYFYEAGLFGGSAPYRRYLYWGLLGGIAGTFFGHEQLWRFDDGTPGTDYTTLLATTGTLDASRLFAFFKARPWHRLRPNGLNSIGTLITAGGGTASPQSTTYVAAAATPEGDLLLAYVPPAHSGAITVDMTKMSGTSAARWFDPTNATFTAIGAFNNAGTQAFSVPGTNSAGAADFLLVLETIAGIAAGVATATAVGASIATAAGTAAGTGAAAGAGASIAQAVGTASGTGTAAASSTNVVQGVGAAAGTSTAGAVGQSTAPAAGASAGTAIATATATAFGAGAGVAAGTAVAIATATAIASSAALAAGTATATAVGSALVAGAGVSTGTSTAVAVGQGLAGGAGTGIAVGSSIAAAVAASVAAFAGVSAGTSSATGVGGALAVVGAVGLAAGTSTARAFQLGEPTTPEPHALSAFEQYVADMDATAIDLLG